MNRLARWILCRIANGVVFQGPNHRSRIIEFYGVLVAAAREEFREDSVSTLDAFLRECHEEALQTTTDTILACKAARDEAQDAFDNGPDERYAYAVEACRAFVCEKCSARAECPVAEREKMT